MLPTRTRRMLQMRWGRTSSPLRQTLSTPRHRGTKRKTTEPPMPLSLPLPFCPLSHCRQKAEAQIRHVSSGTRGGSQLCSSLLGHLFLFIIFKKGKKRKKGFPITSSFPSSQNYPPEPNSSKICHHVATERSPLPSSPSCLAPEGRVWLEGSRGAMASAGPGRGCWRQKERGERDRGPSWKRWCHKRL